MLTESEIQKSFRRIFSENQQLSSDSIERAEQLLDELRPESPLRHRLGTELEELRTLVETKS